MKRYALLTLPFCLLGLPLVLLAPAPIDDALITARYARNLASGAGLVYQTGEAVLGTTAPLWAALTSWIFRLPFSDDVLVALFCALGGVALGAAILLATRQLFPGKSREERLVPAVLALLPTLGLAARMGMETGAVMLFTIVLWRALGAGTPAGSDWAWAGVAAIALLLLRLDTGLLLAVMGATYIVVYRPRRTDQSRAVITATAVAIVLGTWLLVCKAGYGLYLPHSMIAKENFRGASLGNLFGNWLLLLDLNYPWPRSIKLLATVTFPLCLLGATGVALRVHRRLDRAERWMQLTAVSFLVVYGAFLTIGGVGVFPWYAHLPFFLWALAVPAVLFRFRNERAPRLALGSLAVFFLAVDLLYANGVRKQGLGAVPEREVGLELRDRGCHSVMLEPIGYVGFYSRCEKVHDLAGLVSPNVMSLRRTGAAGWFYTAVKQLEPQYVVLRDGEVEANLGWNVGVLFASDAERTAFLAAYERLTSGRPWVGSYTIYMQRPGRPRSLSGELSGS